MSLAYHGGPIQEVRPVHEVPRSFPACGRVLVRVPKSWSLPAHRAAALAVLLACSTSAESDLPASRAAGLPEFPGGERAALAASFVGGGGDLGAFERLLHDSLIVQPPAPDSAVQGADAIRYLTDLAAQTKTAESRLTPAALTPEGPFVFEQGTWMLRAGERLLHGQYTMRWRMTPHGWKVVLWRWSRFR